MVQKKSVASGEFGNMDHQILKAEMEEEEQLNEDEHPQFMQQYNTVVKHNQHCSKLDMNS